MKTNSTLTIAHVRKADGVPQSLHAHLTETAAIAKALAAKLGLDLAGELLGLMHDFGKYSKAFQAYIKAVSGFDPRTDLNDVLSNEKKHRWCAMDVSTFAGFGT